MRGAFRRATSAAGALITVGIGGAMTGASVLWPDLTGPIFFYGGLAVIVLGIALWMIGRLIRSGRAEDGRAGDEVRSEAEGSNSMSLAAKQEGGQNNRIIQAGTYYENAPASPAPDDLRDAPHLLWSSARIEKMHDRFWELWVECSNVGKVALVRPDSWVKSTVDDVTPGPGPDQYVVLTHTPTPEQIEFQDFDVQGPIHPGTFTLRMRIMGRDPMPGSREIRWRIVYMDDDMSRGFITECSATVHLVMGTATVEGTPALDNTSRRDRNADYNEYMKGKKASSTGPRRPYQG